jgi:tetratricopeptide (TPR) repeat protein
MAKLDLLTFYMNKIINSTGFRARKFFVLLLVIYIVASAVRLTAQNVPILSQVEQLASAERLFKAGNDLLNKGDFQQAAQKYSEAIDAAPTFAVLYINRGIAYISLSKHQEALADAEKALSLLETDASPSVEKALAYQVKGTVFLNQKDFKVATELFSKSIDLEPSNAKFWNSRGNAYQVARDYDKALKDYDKSIELDSATALFYVNRATVNNQLNNFSSSLRDLDEALKLDDENPNTYHARGNAYSKLNKLDEALKDYDRAISLKPKPLFYYSRGRLYFILGKYDLAIKDSSDALATDPTMTQALHNRAIAFHKLGNNLQAIEDIRKAVALNEKSASLHYTLAYLHFKSGQFPSTLTEASKAIELAPQWRSPYSLRAAAYAKTGNTVKAKIDRNTASKLDMKSKPVENNTLLEFYTFVTDDLQ